jgi:hypothetical protein
MEAPCGRKSELERQVQGQKQISPLRGVATRASSGRNDTEIQKQNQGQEQGRVQGQKQISPLHIRASANVPVGMTPKFKSKPKGKGNRKGRSRFLRCTFAPARTFRSE